jgi:hypothetical protein
VGDKFSESNWEIAGFEGRQFGKAVMRVRRERKGMEKSFILEVMNGNWDCFFREKKGI